MEHTIGIIGIGNMGAAIAKGLGLNAEEKTVLLCGRDQALITQLTESSELKGLKAASQSDTAQASYLFIAVKPQDFPALAESLRHQVKAETVIISVMAGIRIQSIQDLLGARKVIRTMPNLGAKIGQSMTLWCASANIIDSEKEKVKQFLECIGKQLEVEKEDLIDAGTAVAGSGPAYFFHMIEGLEQSAVELGFSTDQARLLTDQTMKASYLTWHETGQSAQSLREAVTSKKGTTDAALTYLAEKEWIQTFITAVKKAYQRAKELGQ